MNGALQRDARATIVVDVEVDRSTGKISRKFGAAGDCGLIINPHGLKHH